MTQQEIANKIRVLNHIYLKLGLIPFEPNEETGVEQRSPEIYGTEEKLKRIENSIIEIIKNGDYGRKIYYLEDIENNFPYLINSFK